MFKIVSDNLKYLEKYHPELLEKFLNKEATTHNVNELNKLVQQLKESVSKTEQK